jgi:hypothetical protein
MTSDPVNESVASELAKEIARKTLYSNYDPLLACRDLASLRGRLLGVAEDLMTIFLGVASEIDDLPIGTEREHWAAATLTAKDVEAENYRGRVRDTVKEALQQLLSELGGPHTN